MLEKNCEHKRTQLSQKLNMINLPPDLYALNLMEQTGYSTHIAGEVYHIIKCTSVVGEIANDLDICYEQLPVYLNNELRFLTPKSGVKKNYNLKSC